MRYFLSAILVLFISSCADPEKERLYGSWKSNKDLTISTFHYKKKAPLKARKKVEDIFGKLELTYTKSEIIAFSPSLGSKGGPWHQKFKYKILGHDADSVVILSRNPLTNKPEITQIHFIGKDRYWVYLYSSGWKEYFDRINKTEQGAAANP
jgi:hypothetical protein